MQGGIINEIVSFLEFMTQGHMGFSKLFDLGVQQKIRFFLFDEPCEKLPNLNQGNIFRLNHLS